SDPAIRSGMACEVTFRFESDAEGFTLPPVAVQEDRAGRYVYVVELTEGEQGVTRRRPVEVGGITSRGLQIRSGLSDGDLVVTAGVSRIVDGQVVKLLAR
ncbi:MAG: efflux RND transporter periplasmic adaptor subunit, partial [Gemmatimonadetes bacterium]|nr:efflux RND transporter periplasmic adaptor subunit [Gemmatimonadota bacterium]